MDTSKWKSVAVSIENYEMLKELAKQNHRSVSGQLAYIIEQLSSKKAA